LPHLVKEKEKRTERKNGRGSKLTVGNGKNRKRGKEVPIGPVGKTPKKLDDVDKHREGARGEEALLQSWGLEKNSFKKTGGQKEEKKKGKRKKIVDEAPRNLKG